MIVVFGFLQKLPKAVFTCEDAAAATAASADDVDVEGDGEVLEEEKGSGGLSFSTGMAGQEVRDFGIAWMGAGGRGLGEHGLKGKTMYSYE